MKIKALTLMLAVLFSAVGIAQTTDKDLNPQDPKAKELLEKLRNKVMGFESFKADLEYTLENKAAGLKETQEGSLLMKGKKKYKVAMSGREIYCNGETIWTYIPDVGELQITDIPDEEDEEGNIMNPANVFNMYEKGFKYQHTGQETVDGKTLDVIKMYPMNPEGKPFHTLIVYIDAEKLQLEKMVVKAKDGNTYTYKLKNFKSNVGAKDSDFEFDESEAEDVIDLRE